MNTAERTMTLGEFVEYAETYEYSKEYYELQKECSEIALMEMYLKANRYVKENGNIADETILSFNESVDIEYIEEGVKEGLKKVGKTLKNIGKRIIDGLVAIYKAVVNFFTKTIPDALKKLKDKIKEIAGSIKGFIKKVFKKNKKQAESLESVVHLLQESFVVDDCPEGVVEIEGLVQDLVNIEDDVDTGDIKSEEQAEAKVSRIKEAASKALGNVKKGFRVTMEFIHKQFDRFKKLASKAGTKAINLGKAGVGAIKKVLGAAWGIVQKVAGKVVDWWGQLIKRVRAAIDAFKAAIPVAEAADEGGGEAPAEA